MTKPTREDRSAQRDVSSSVITIPNVLSFLRLVGVPIFLWAIVSAHDGIAVATLMLSGITDYLDGKIARTFHMESRVGQLLDPIADRLYILSTLLGLCSRDIIPVWLVIVILSREVVMFAMLTYLKLRGQTGLPVHFVGKAATLNLLYAFPLLLMAIQPGALGAVAKPLGWGFAWWGICLYWLAALIYARQAVSVLRAIRRSRRA